MGVCVFITDLRAFLRSYKRCGAVLIPFAMCPVKLIFTISMYSGRNIIALHSYQLSKTKSGFHEMEQYTFVRDEVWNTQKMVKSTMANFFKGGKPPSNNNCLEWLLKFRNCWQKLQFSSKNSRFLVFELNILSVLSLD